MVGRRTFLRALLVGTSGLWCGCSGRRERGRVSTLHHTRCPVPSGSSIAFERGWIEREFAPDGIHIVALGESSTAQTRGAHYDHRQSALFRHGGNIPAIWARSTESAGTSLIGMSWLDHPQMILTMPSTGIRTVRDLRGRRLGLPKRLHDPIDHWRATCLRGYLAALTLEGMDERDVDMVDVPVQRRNLSGPASKDGSLFSPGWKEARGREELLAMVRGEVDACFATTKGHEHAAFLGARAVVDLAKHPDREVRTNNLTPLTLTVNEELVHARPDLVSRYLARVLEAARWAEGSAREANRIFAREAGMSEEWTRITYGDNLSRQLAVSLVPELITALKSQVGFLHRRGFIPRNLDVDGWIEPAPMRTCRGS